MASKTKDDEYQVQVIPIAKCEPDPLTVFRYDYTGPDVVALSESIQKNDQLEPGYARLDKKTGMYRIYLGQRRLAAVKMALKRGAKIKGYKAIVSDVSDDEAIERAITENVERNDLDVTEWMRMAHRVYGSYAKDKRKAVAETSGLKVDSVDSAARLYERLTDDVVKSIYDLEQKTGTKLSLSHVEKIAAAKGTEAVLAVTKHVCERQLPASQVNQQLIDLISIKIQAKYSGAATSLGQPAPADNDEESEASEKSPAKAAERELDSGSSRRVDSIPRLNGDFLTSDGWMFECPKGHANFLELRGSFVMKFKDPLDSPKDSVYTAQDASPDFVIEATKACWKCQTPVVVRIASTEGTGITMDTAKSGSVKPFSKAPVKVSVYCDFDKKKYTVTKTDASERNKEFVLDKTGSLKAEGR